MRRFFYDTEFSEWAPEKKDGIWVPGGIDLISIGVVPEKGKSFYAVSKDFDGSKASKWVKQNVLTKLPPRSGSIQSSAWMSREEIRKALLAYLRPSADDPIQLWAYYSAYDHVVLCWLFGAMIDLPQGMPMYTMDLKQMAVTMGNPKLPKQSGDEHDALEDAKWVRKAWQYLNRLRSNRSVDLME